MGIEIRLSELEDDLKTEIAVQENPRIAYPDSIKREQARIELRSIYHSTGWYQFGLRWKIRRILDAEYRDRTEDDSGPKMCERRG